jgi:hypothetical protein
MKKFLFIVVATLGLSATARSQPQPFSWAYGYGGTLSSNRDFAHGVSTDTSGNAYVCGQFQGNMSVQSQSAASGGYREPFVTKFDSSGACLWLLQGYGQGSSTLPDLATSIATDAGGNSYVTGMIGGPYLKLGTDTIYSCNSGADFFVAKVSKYGHVAWFKGLCATNDIRGNSITIDAFSNCYITGSFTGTVTVNNNSYTSTGTQGVYIDPFVLKMDSSGNFLWFKPVLATGDNSMALDGKNDQGLGIKADFCGNTYVTGQFGGNADFGNNVLISGYGTSDIFIAKYNSEGNCLWARAAGSPFTDHGNAISIDSLGNSYVTGFFQGNATFGTMIIYSQGLNPDIFIAKYDDNGNFLWVRKPGSNASLGDEGKGIITTGNGISYVCGHFSGTATFGIDTVTANNGTDLFIAKYGSNGGCYWVKTAGGTGNESASGISLDNTNNQVYTCGRFLSDTAFFDSFNLYNQGSNQQENWFICDFRENISSIVNYFPPSISQNGNVLICSPSFTSYQWYLNGNPISGATARFDTINASGMYSVCITAQGGCTICSENFNAVFTTEVEIPDGIELLSIYPNPAQNIINVKVDAKLVGSTYIIYDNTGKSVLSDRITSENTSIELVNLSGGLYFLSVGNSKKQTFIVIKE